MTVETLHDAPADERRFLFVLGSAREGGNSESLARRAANFLPSHVRQEWIRLSDLDIPRFEDVRHSGDGTYTEPAGDAGTLWRQTLAATDLVVVSPLYWYSVSASVKLYLDHWSAWMRVPGTDFEATMGGKRMWAVTAYASDDVTLVDPLLGTLRNSAGRLRMHWGGALLANGSKPGQALDDPATLERAAEFFAAAGARTGTPVRAGS
ncbi:NAD(P)H-dependent oxidoreductase [Myceligenerans sp. TRM 65318]|uniref:NAD(P)H-dependent oxidoreductase n=2 Tax=Myceligenerans pegani TaxID=2776917 RepID=A0ABR9N1P6_9MICO|nr:NAD(P)H-dependent oxidoreductase [Myceligenerans sp. TRM 65318]MBE3019269.1 NAD(P)H-dependent oxidoreductase [Myceligenerans sp. TRM 65318]